MDLISQHPQYTALPPALEDLPFPVVLLLRPVYGPAWRQRILVWKQARLGMVTASSVGTVLGLHEEAAMKILGQKAPPTGHAHTTKVLGYCLPHHGGSHQRAKGGDSRSP